MIEPPVLPDYAGACTTNLMKALVEEPDGDYPWLPVDLSDVSQIALLVLDGLGWNQFVERRSRLVHLDRLKHSRITTVCPTTTATALTSITTGLPPGEHGIIGYRMLIRNEVLNVLRWSTGRGDARESIHPGDVQPNATFGHQRPPAITRAEFIATGFTEAHLDPVRFVGYRMPSTMATEVSRLVRSGEPFVYAYYDGIDKVAHEYGLGEHYEAELAACDHMVGHLASTMPPDSALVVTSDHGQVDVNDRIIRLDPEILSLVRVQSGEARFRWLHAVPGGAVELLEAARSAYSDCAWVVSAEQVLDEQWFGPVMTDRARASLGDVALVPFEPVAFDDPADTGPFVLKSRHGSMTPDEVYVPLFVSRT